MLTVWIVVQGVVAAVAAVAVWLLLVGTVADRISRRHARVAGRPRHPKMPIFRRFML